MGRSWNSAEIERLLEQRTALRQLVVRLVGADAADDVVQETYVRALQAPRARGDAASWMVRIARNVASTSRREARRRARREAQAAASSERLGAAADEVLIELESLEQVSRALRELPEPYRATLLQRFVASASTADIARAEGVGRDAVRQRIKRGLDLLRERIAPTEPDRRALALAFGLPLVRLSQGVGPAATVKLSWWSAAVWSWLMMSKHVVLVAVAASVLATAILGVLLTRPDVSHRGSGDLPGARGDFAAAVDGPGSAGEELPARTVVEAGGLSRGAAAEPGAADHGSLEMRVRWTDDGSPAGNVRLHLQDPWLQTPPGPVPSADTDASGVAVFESLPVGELQVADRFQDSLAGGSLEIRAGETTRVEVEIERWLRVRGRVVDEMGVGIGAAEVVAASGFAFWATPVAVTDSEGGFEAEVPVRGSLGALAAGYAPSRLVGLAGERGETTEVTIPLSRDAARIEVRVLDGRDRPIPGAVVAAGPFGQQQRPFVGPDGLRRLVVPRPVFTDADGRCVLHAAGGAIPVEVSAAGFGGWCGEVEAAAGQRVPLAVHLEAPVVVAGVVRDTDAEPLADVSVECGESGSLLHRWTRSAADGGYELAGLPAGSQALSARRGGTEIQATRRASRGTRTTWDPVFAAGSRLAGVLLDADGAPVAGRLLTFLGSEDSGWFDSVRTDGRGGFAVGGLPATVRIRVLVTVGIFQVPVFDGELPSGELVLRLDGRTHAASASLRGRLVDHHGLPIAAARIGLTRDGSLSSPVLRADTDGAFGFQVPPGRYTLDIEAEGQARRVTGAVVVAAGGQAEFGTLVLEQAARFEVRFTAALELPESMSLHYARRGAPGWTGVQILDGRGGAGDLAPGDYRMQVGGGGFAYRCFEVHLPAGRTTELVEDLQAGTAVVFAVTIPSDRSQPAFGRLSVAGDDGELVLDRRIRIREDGSVPGDWRFDPGRYRARLVTDGLAAVQSFEVRSPRGEHRVELRLRRE